MPKTVTITKPTMRPQPLPRCSMWEPRWI